MTPKTVTPKHEVRRTKDGSNTLFSNRYEQTYHSHHGAESESLHVFFSINKLNAHLLSQTPTRILEIGYGTGLNGLILASKCKTLNAHAELFTLEHNRLPAGLLRQLRHETLASVDEDIVQQWLRFEEASKNIMTLEQFTMTIIEGDARYTSWPTQGPFDFVWQDAFSEDKNPELWDESFLTQVFDSMAPGGVMSTYSVKGAIRRRLQSVGFKVGKKPGPPNGKREVLCAYRP